MSARMRLLRYLCMDVDGVYVEEAAEVGKIHGQRESKRASSV